MQLIVEEFPKLHLLVILFVSTSTKLRIDVVLAILNVIFVLEVLFDEQIVFLNVCRVALGIP